MFIKIIRQPIGEAPEWVRDAWVGLRLPVVEPKQRKWPTLGVLTGPHGILKQLWALASGRTRRVHGYLVDAKSAVDLLAGSNPAAAEWWRSNASRLVDGRRKFVFDQEACALEGE
ncbi:MAG: hypothetical protein LH466_00175 [Sphingomonas bacterium]|nr:hypothetical protein [Sphingomonas bacterium]